jgi:myo-inositol 2-dehydrogenase/D-chiro-inositol 1-dehydrogenase
MSTDLSPTRRGFLKSAAATGAVLAAANAITAHAAGSDEIRVGMVGCGSRGKGACENVLSSSKGVKIVALGDVFKEKAYELREHLTGWVKSGKAKELGNGVDAPPDRCFGGLDAYEKVINSPEVNYVMLATPPGFRPPHIQAAVAAGKNLFTEKPVGVDATGIRKVLAAYEEAKKKGLYIVAGTQRRHQLAYQKTIQKIHDGAIGDIVNLRVYWNGGGIWFNKRKPDMTDVAYQLNNWYHFVWLCGDHIVEQHVHNLDVANWVMNGPPEKADGAGGRTPGNPSRPEGPPEVTGNIYDNFSIDYTYPNGAHMYSSCRHLPQTAGDVSEHMIGTKGMSDTRDGGDFKINGERVTTRQENAAATNPYVQEHTDLIACIRGGTPVNELKQVAESTLTAIMGRTAAYTGKAITWKQMMESKLDTMPANLTWETALPIVPVPHPGQTKFI